MADKNFDHFLTPFTASRSTVINQRQFKPQIKLGMDNGYDLTTYVVNHVYVHIYLKKEDLGG